MSNVTFSHTLKLNETKTFRLKQQKFSKFFIHVNMLQNMHLLHVNFEIKQLIDWHSWKVMNHNVHIGIYILYHVCIIFQLIKKRQQVNLCTSYILLWMGLQMYEIAELLDWNCKLDLIYRYDFISDCHFFLY